MNMNTGEKKQRNKKLVIQVGLMNGLLFAAAITIISLVVYYNGGKTYIKATQNDMIKVLTPLRDSLEENVNLKWLLDYTHTHTPWDSEEIMSDYENTVFDYCEKIGKWIYEVDEEDIKKADPDIQDAFACYYLNEIDNLFLDSWGGSGFCVFKCVDLTDERGERCIFPYRDYKSDEDFIEDFLDDEVKKTILSSDREWYFHVQTENNEDDFSGYRSLGMISMPVYLDGKPVLVIEAGVVWDEIWENSGKTAISSVIASIISLSIVAVIISCYIYKKTIKPMEKIEKGLDEYIKDQNAGALATSMSAIKERNEIGLLADNIKSLGIAVDRYTRENVTLASEKARVDSELNLAKSIQTNMVPHIFPAFPDRKEFDIHAYMNPAKEVGGDFYDFFLIDDDHLALVMADVSGKGVPAALFMMMSKILIKNYLSDGMSPETVLEKANEVICRNNPKDMFVTVWVGVLEISTGRLTACSAGHEYPLVARSWGGFSEVRESQGFVVGGIEGLKYEKYEIMLGKGSTIFLYTDGVPEATNSQGELFGMKRLQETLNRIPEGSPESLLAIVKSEVGRFVGEAPQFDDITMLCLQLR